MPDKIENQHKGAAAEEAAAAEAAARAAASSAVLTSEDCAIYRACTYTSPDLFKRAWLRFASTKDTDSILSLPVNGSSGSNGSGMSGDVSTTSAHGRAALSPSSGLPTGRTSTTDRRSQGDAATNYSGPPAVMQQAGFAGNIFVPQAGSGAAPMDLSMLPDTQQKMAMVNQPASSRLPIATGTAAAARHGLPVIAQAQQQVMVQPRSGRLTR